MSLWAYAPNISWIIEDPLGREDTDWFMKEKEGPVGWILVRRYGMRGLLKSVIKEDMVRFNSTES